MKWHLQSSFFLLHSAAIDLQEAKDSIDEEDLRPTSSTWSYITGARGFSPLIKDISKKYDLSLMFLLETHASKEVAARSIPRLGFDSHFVQDAYGHSGGIWCL